MIFLKTALENGEDKGTTKCPQCGSETGLHARLIGIAPHGEVYTNTGQRVGDDLTHRKRDKVITFFQCEMCDNGPEQVPHIIRVEVNHKGTHRSGIYHIPEGISTQNIRTISVYEGD